MRKGLIVAATAVALAGGSALAYTAMARDGGPGFGRFHRGMNTEDMSAFADARIAALRAGLALTAEQQNLWPPVETALKELASKRIERREEFREAMRDRDGRDDRPNPIERLRKGSERMGETSADLKRLADATEPLYNSLDDAQKRRFNLLAASNMRPHMMQRHGGHHWRKQGDRDGGPHKRWRDRSERAPEQRPAERL